MKKNLFCAIIGLFISVNHFAQQTGGMWLPNELNEKEMKKLGLKISRKDIFNSQKPSLKDAVVNFNKGCTAEIISPQGLLLTNHHCGFRQIQSHSTPENDLLTQGFWAKNRNEELPNPDLAVDFIIDIQDITKQILSGDQHIPAQNVKSIIEKNIASMQANFKGKPYQNLIIKPMYEGNKYYAFITETFKDIRLVGAPPESIGKFGADTDNWVWPRHSGDFSLFRIYAGPDNKPAEYAPDNIPYTPKHFLPISVRDLKEGDFTFLMGFPGKTTEYLPAIAVEKLIQYINPAKINIRKIALKTLDQKMRISDTTRIKYASKYASIANHWKKWMGESEGLKKSNAVAIKQAYEQFLIQENPQVKIKLDKLTKLYNQQTSYALYKAYYDEILKNSETLDLANHLISYTKALDSGTANTASAEKLKNKLISLYKNYESELDVKVTAKLIALYTQEIPTPFLPLNFKQFQHAERNLITMENWSKNSILCGRKAFKGIYLSQKADQIFTNGDLLTALRNDPFYQFALSLRQAYDEKVAPQYKLLEYQIHELQKEYIKLQMEIDKKKKFFPDANATLRISYGVVKGSHPRDAVYYHYKTYLSGIMEKYIPGDYEFDLPKKFIELYHQKDYGNYKDATGEVPVNFTATNHTTGGNSGSPVLDAHGYLIGLNFDRQWEGTMSDIHFDPKFSRNIMVNTQYILFIIDKFANAKWLLDEIKIVF
ncbi:serine protease [Elizabethkingia argentiflava]|uniref:Dipeptidyl-peptidase n=1 Tax=Elizabethkingia argenteiflava TaxID=2681556 RepID=A0A845PXG1_9FLAO|nr:S46 family peptidase [Elizabethkingia argenteiflava]NAW51631.1 serine protease [Elizabethkingia argenteiflava]